MATSHTLVNWRLPFSDPHGLLSDRPGGEGKDPWSLRSTRWGAGLTPHEVRAAQDKLRPRPRREGRTESP